MKRSFIVTTMVCLLIGCGAPPPPPQAQDKPTLLAADGLAVGRVEADKFNPLATGNEMPVPGGEVVVRFSSEPDNLSLIDNSAVTSYITTYIYNALLSRDPETYEFEPSLAERWLEEDVVVLQDGRKLYGTVSREGDAVYLEKDGVRQRLADGTVAEIRERVAFTFFLRHDVKFHDGTPLTARDVEFSYQLIKCPFVRAPHLRSYYDDLTECRVIDDYTIQLEYAKQYWKAREYAGGFEVLPEHIYNADGLLESDPEAFGERFNNSAWLRKPVGTGPYIFDSWETGREVVLRRNEHYWDTDEQPYLDKLVFRFITDNVAALQALKNGEVDFIPSMSSEQWLNETTSDDFHNRFVKCEYYTGGYGYIGWNMRRPPFDDQRVRLAMAYGALDRAKFLEEVNHGLGVIVTGSQYYYGPAYDHTIEPYPYDPEKAKALLLEAGWFDHDGDGIRDKDGQPFAFELLNPQLPPNSPAKKRVEIMIENLSQLGIRMTVKELEWATFIDAINNREFDACQLAWASSLESDPYQLWHTSQIADGGSNHCGFGNEATDDLIERSRLMLDDTARRQLFFALHRIHHEQQPYLFLYTSPDLGVYSNRYRNVKFYVIRPGYDLSEWFIPQELQ